MSRPRHFLLVCSVWLLALFAPTSRAQFPSPVNNDTRTPEPGSGHDYIHMLTETVDPSSGSLSVRISTPVPSSRGITIPFSFDYSSGAVKQAQVLGTSSGVTSAGWAAPTIVGGVALTSGGWSYRIPELTANQKKVTCQTQGNNETLTTNVWADYIFTDPSGSRHNLQVAHTAPLNGDCVYATEPYNVSSGGDDFYSASLNETNGAAGGAVTVVGVDGTVYNFPATGFGGNYGVNAWLPSTIEDRNGNTVTISEGSGGNITQTDTVGRSAVSTSAPVGTNGTVSISGLSNAYTVTWETTSASYGSQYEQLGDGYNDGCDWLVAGGGPSNIVIKSIELPNGTYYTFAYNSYGLLSQISYPTGAVVNYTWSTPSSPNGLIEFPPPSSPGNLDGCAFAYYAPMITQRTVKFDGVDTALVQNFSYTTAYNAGVEQATALTTVYSSNGSTNLGTFKTVYNYYPFLPTDVSSPDEWNTVASVIPVEQTVYHYDYGQTNLLETVTKGWQDEHLLGCQLDAHDGSLPRGTFYTYGAGGVVTDKKEYDYGQVTTSQCPQAAEGGPITAPTGQTRETAATYQVFANTPIFPNSPSILDRPCSVVTKDSSGNKAAETDYLYDGGTSVCGTAGTASVASGNTPIQHDPAYAYTASPQPPRGNATTKSVWVSSSGATLGTTYTFDETGQIRSMTDPRLDQTTYSYADSYSSGTPPGQTNAYLTQVTYPNTGVAHIEKFSYAYASAEVTSSTDQNNLVTSYTYNDSLARLTKTAFPDGGSTTIAYNDSPYNSSTPSPSVTTTKTINSSTSLITVSAYDGLYHPVRSEVTSDPQGTIYTDTVYDGLAHVYTVSNPYRSGTDPTTSSGTTTYIYDALGRKCVEVPQDGTAVSANTCPTTAPAKDLFTQYSGSTITVTDQTGKKRQSTTDGLGRLIQVVESPGGLGYVTNYTLDTLGNLKQVVQNGSHTRTFTYDFISRLLTSNNPEVGTITYNYDSDTNCSGTNSFPGLLVSKVDARGIRTCAQYDALNRETVHNYSNGDPTVSTTYDQANCLGLTACQNIGHATSVTDAAGSESSAYQVDSANLRSIHVNQRTTTSSPSNITKTSTYYFDLASNLTSITYPTGRIVNYTYDAANRAATAVDSANGITYAAAQVTPPTGCLAAGACYTPQGTEYSSAIGKTTSFNGINLSETYNSRLQPLEIKASSSAGSAFDITYSFVDPTSSGNAGHVNSITNNLDGTRSQTFSYDQLNRITGALTTSTYATSPSHCWGETYGLDAWGNLNSIAATTNSSYAGCSEESGFSTTADANNHLPIFGYDVSGNTQSDGTIAYTYDAESQIKTAAGVTYLYDGSGRRVSKSSGKLYWYGSGGEILAETTATGATLNEYIFFSGKRVAMLPAGGNPEYYAEDFLGSSRVTTTNTGTVCYDADFYPYGGERAYTNNCPSANVYKFEGKERDTETGNDDFGARYYSNRFGRWLSADWSSTPVAVPYANLTNPQTLNLYAMVSDDPESFADLDGHDDQPSLWDQLMSYLGLSVRAYSSAGSEEQLKSGQTLGGSDMTLNDALRVQNKANEEAAKQVQNTMQALDPSPGNMISTIAGRAAGTRTNGDVAMSFASVGLGLGVSNAIKSAQNILTNRFTTATFQAAEKEAQGIVVAVRPDGKPFDHIGALKQGLQGLKNDATTLTNSLKNDTLSQAQREAISANLRQINTTINQTLKFFKKNNINP
jgi:RHS repeat-associated protein